MCMPFSRKQNMSETKTLKKVPPEAFRRQLLAILPVILSSFIAGNTTSWTSNAIYLFNKGDPEPFTALQCSMIASSSEIGCIVFSLPVGYIIDKVGRHTIMVIVGIINSLAWIILSFLSSYTSIIIARFVLGIGEIMVLCTSTVAIGELSSPEIRAQMISINQLFFFLGQIFPSLLNIIFSSYHILSYSGTIISALYFLTLYFSIETPYFFVSKSRYEEAKANLNIIRIGYSETEIDEEFENFKKYIEEEKNCKRELNWWKFFGSGRILKPLLIALLIHHFVQAMGSYVIITYITKIIPNNIEFLPKRFYPFIIQFLRIISSLCIPFFIELFPRRVTFLSITLFTFFFHLLIGTTYFCFTELSINFCQWVMVVCVLLLLGIGTSFILSVMNTMRGELFPHTIKGIGTFVCAITSSSTCILYFQVYRFITENYSQYWIFFIFSINALVLFFIIYFLLPETRGKFLADIQVKQCKKVDDRKECAEVQ